MSRRTPSRKAEFLEQQALAARAATAQALGDTRRALARAADPRIMVRTHPVGTAVTFGIAALLAVGALRAATTPGYARAFFVRSYRAIRGLFVAGFFSGFLRRAIGRCARPTLLHIAGACAAPARPEDSGRRMDDRRLRG